jgi:hypothetical protein
MFALHNVTPHIVHIVAKWWQTARRMVANGTANGGKRHGKLGRHAGLPLRTWVWQPTIGVAANVVPCTDEYRGEWKWAVGGDEWAVAVIAKWGQTVGRNGGTAPSVTTTQITDFATSRGDRIVGA